MPTGSVVSDDATRLLELLKWHPGSEFGAPIAAAAAAISVDQANQYLADLSRAHLLERIAPDRFRLSEESARGINQIVADAKISQEGNAVLQQILNWYLHTAAAARLAVNQNAKSISLNSTATPDPLTFADRATALDWYKTEYDNLTAAAKTASGIGMYQLAWQLLIVFRTYFRLCDSLTDYGSKAELALAIARNIGNQRDVADALHALAGNNRMLRRMPEAHADYLAALTIYRELDDKACEADVLESIGIAYLTERKFTEALDYLEQSRTLWAELADRENEAAAISNLADTYCGLSQLDRATELANQSLTIRRELKNRLGESISLAILADIAEQEGRPAEALELIEASVAMAYEFSQGHLGYDLLELARIQLGNGLTAQAIDTYQRALTLHQEIKNRQREGIALDRLGEVYQKLGRLDEAIEHHRQAVAIQRELDEKWYLAIALNNLANALQQTGKAEQAQTCWQEALTAANEYSDPQAVKLQTRIAEAQRA